MKIVIGFYESSFSEETYSEKRKILMTIEQSINQLIEDVNYGKSIETILIGLIAVEPIYDKFFKPRRPRYTEHKETMAFGSIPIVIHKTLEIEIKMDYETCLNAEGGGLRKMIVSEVTNTLRTIKLPKKVADFNKERFVADLESFFRSEHLLN